MTSPSLALQASIISVLRAGSVATGGVFDSAPSSADFPYISLGPSDEVPDGADCVAGWIVTQQIDVWSRATGHPEVRRIAASVSRALHRADLSLDGWHLIDLRVVSVRYTRDPDGLTTHGIIEVRALIESE